MLFSPNRDAIRQAYIDTWRKQRTGQPLSPLEQMIASVIRMHPEYHAELETGGLDAAASDSVANPFLHMGLHIALHEQLQTDRPGGIRAVYQQLVDQVGDVHLAEHQMMMCLEQVLWTSQQTRQPPDEANYLLQIQQLL